MTTNDLELSGGAAILLVEDTAVQAMRFKTNLEENGCMVRWVENGRDGLQAAHESFYDLIILDIELPDISGFEVCRRLKADPSVAEIPVIMLTTRDRAEDALNRLEHRRGGLHTQRHLCRFGPARNHKTDGATMNTMNKTVSERIVIKSDLDIITARLRAREVARELGFGTIDQARISLAASELARILALKMSAPGEILIAGVNTPEHVGIQVTSIDSSDEKLLEADGEVTQEPLDDAALSNALALVDEGFVEQVGAKNIRVTLYKWLLNIEIRRVRDVAISFLTLSIS
ncbi:MAG: response regulator [Anaerolineae bacterium]|nr:response regulator [Anaerolineae bacterium]